VKVVPFESIERDTNVRIDEGDLEPLIESISRTRWIAPLQVCELGHGRYRLVAGYRRHSAISRLRARGEQFDEVPVQVITSRDVQITENMHRSALRPIEVYQAFHGAQVCGDSAADIATRYGVSLPTVYRVLTIGKLHPDIRRQLERGVNTVRLEQLAEISRLPLDEQERAFDVAQGFRAAKAKRKRLTRTNVKRMIKRLEGRPESAEQRGGIAALRELLGE
jgi:ParB family chromosome partitioning protein